MKNKMTDLNNDFDEDIHYLSEDERNYLSKLIKAAEIDVTSIAKLDLESWYGLREYICVSYLLHCADTVVTRVWNLPVFEVGQKFKGLQLNRFYTMKELGL